MKKTLTAILLSLVAISSASACCYRGYHGGYHSGGWIGPAVVGGVIGYELSRPRETVIVQQPSVIVQPAPVVVQQPPIGYHYQQMINPQTNQYQLVLVPN